MFTNLANYLLGSIINQDQGATAEGVENTSLRLTSAEQDDWVLVDRNSDGNSDTLSIRSLDEEEGQESDTDRPPSGALTRTSSSMSLPPYTSNMEDSWFITPPPCFTSAGPINMETSPLENLLIEHPSMSVYYHYSGRRHVFVPVRTPSPLPIEIEEVELQVEETTDTETGEQVVRTQNRASRLTEEQVVQQQERQHFKSRRAQKAQIKKACEVFKRGCLQRNNKAREVNSRNCRQRRGERSQGANRSYANNNRKC